jgi:hypothetical protein
VQGPQHPDRRPQLHQHQARPQQIHRIPAIHTSAGTEIEGTGRAGVRLHVDMTFLVSRPMFATSQLQARS